MRLLDRFRGQAASRQAAGGNLAEPYGGGRWNRLAGMLVLVTVTTLLAWGVGIASWQSGTAEPAAPVAAEREAAPRAVRFALPDDFDRRGAEGEFVVTGVEVGYFEPGGSQPFWWRHVLRHDIAIVSPGVGEIALPMRAYPGGKQVVLRLRTLAGDVASVWSEPSAAYSLTALPNAEPSAGGGRTRRARTARVTPRLTADDLAAHPALEQALDAIRPETMSKEVAVSAFRNVQELATAVVWSREFGLPFARVHSLMTAATRRSLQQVVIELRPDLKGTDANRQVQRDARQLVRPRPQRR